MFCQAVWLRERNGGRERGRDCCNHVNNYNGYISDLCFFILGNVHKKSAGKKYRQQEYLLCGKCQGVARCSVTF